MSAPGRAPRLKVMTIVGTRPEIIKMSRILAELDAHTEHVLVHTGQNSDHELNQVFFDELSVRPPDHVLDAVGVVGAVVGREEAVARVARRPGAPGVEGVDGGHDPSRPEQGGDERRHPGRRGLRSGATTCRASAQTPSPRGRATSPPGSSSRRA